MGSKDAKRKLKYKSIYFVGHFSIKQVIFYVLNLFLFCLFKKVQNLQISTELNVLPRRIKIQIEKITQKVLNSFGITFVMKPKMFRKTLLFVGNCKQCKIITNGHTKTKISRDDSFGTEKKENILFMKLLVSYIV